MEIRYKSTRGNGETITASEAILKGLADDGGLYVPTQIPALDISFSELAEMNYREVAYLVMSKFFSDFTEEELKNCINKAYDSKFDTEEIAPLKTAGEYEFLELFHGATIAFKDMALSILPHLLTTSGYLSFKIISIKFDILSFLNLLISIKTLRDKFYYNIKLFILKSFY